MDKPTPTAIEKQLTPIDLIVSKSDEKGNITYVNPVFIKISGYSQASLLEKPHAILRHPDMPKAIFHYLWQNITEGSDVVAYVKNLCSDGSYYWVMATVKMAKNPDGSFRNYLSTRKAITPKAKEYITKLYQEILDVEKTQGVEASYKMFADFLAQNNLEQSSAFNNFMKQLNN